MSVKYNAHIISHTHWDREWFLNSKYTNEWLVPFFDSLLEMVDKEDDYRFVLDGQTSMIEDYFAELEKQGKDSLKYKKRLRKFVKAGQILIGPYFLQPDWQLLSGEALIRNLLIGHKIGEELGGAMKTGWLLDNFGQISQTVQIHKKFGLNGLFLWRGVEMAPDNINSEFLWKSPDGSELVSVYFLSSYRNAMRLAEYKNILKERIKNEVKKISPFATTSNVLLMNGYDQEMIPDDILPELEKLSFPDINVKQSTPSEYVNSIIEEEPALKVLEGALYSGRYISVFPGILSARMYLKLMNDTCQRELESYTEPLSVMSWLNGGQYNKETILHAWKMLLKNHPHDSICGVSIDDVHTDMENRFAETFSIARGITEEKLNELALNIDTITDKNERKPYIIFNSSLLREERVVNLKIDSQNLSVTDRNGKFLPWQRGSKNNLYLYLDEIPGLGYKTVYLEELKEDNQESKQFSLSDEVKVKENFMENKYLRVKINTDGSLNIFDKINELEYTNMGLFVDDADSGDEYNYSYPDTDLKISSQNKQAKIEIMEAGPLKGLIKINLIMNLPESITDDRKTRSKKLRSFPIVNWISLDVNSAQLKFRTEVKNTVKDHRLRVLFPTGISTEYSYAGTQFDVTRHKIKPEIYDDSNIPEDVKRIIIGAREAESITTFPQRYFVDINDSKKGIAVLNKGLPEYEILPENNTIALTLFRSVGWLARGDLLTRIGDAGPVIYTPEAQCLRNMSFEYALYFHQGDCRQGKVYNQAKKFNHDLNIVRTDQHDGNLETENQFLELDSKNKVLQLTALKRAENRNSIIIRLFNPTDYGESGIISAKDSIKAAYYLNLNEKKEKAIDILDRNRININVKPREIITIEIEIAMQGILKKIKNGDIEILNNSVITDTDFSKYESLPLISQEDITQEKKRWQEAEEKLNQAIKKVDSLSNKVDNFIGSNNIELARLKADFHKAKGDVTTYRRTALEAKLSLVLSSKKYLEKKIKDEAEYAHDIEEIDQQLRDIGYALNQARVDKRVYEYIVEYYQHQLKLINENKRK